MFFFHSLFIGWCLSYASVSVLVLPPLLSCGYYCCVIIVHFSEGGESAFDERVNVFVLPPPLSRRSDDDSDYFKGRDCDHDNDEEDDLNSCHFARVAATEPNLDKAANRCWKKEKE